MASDCVGTFRDLLRNLLHGQWRQLLHILHGQRRILINQFLQEICFSIRDPVLIRQRLYIIFFNHLLVVHHSLHLIFFQGTLNIIHDRGPQSRCLADTVIGDSYQNGIVQIIQVAMSHHGTDHCVHRHI